MFAVLRTSGAIHIYPSDPRLNTILRDPLFHSHVMPGGPYFSAVILPALLHIACDTTISAIEWGSVADFATRHLPLTTLCAVSPAPAPTPPPPLPLQNNDASDAIVPAASAESVVACVDTSKQALSHAQYAAMPRDALVDCAVQKDLCIKSLQLALRRERRKSTRLAQRVDALVNADSSSDDDCDHVILAIER